MYACERLRRTYPESFVLYNDMRNTKRTYPLLTDKKKEVFFVIKIADGVIRLKVKVVYFYRITAVIYVTLR